MKNRLEQGLLTLLVFVSLFFSWRACAARSSKAASNVISKVFHHRGGLAKDAHVEMGNCVLYFSNNPQVIPRTIVQKDRIYEEHVYFLPQAQLGSEECKRMVTRVNKMVTEPYTLKVASVTKPSRGVEIRVRCPRGTCVVDYKRFESIGRKKGLVVYVYNKKVLDSIKNQKKPVLQVASNGRHRLPRIVIDDGHGGSDTGAVGCNHIQEKDICLRVGTKVASLLRNAGYDVLLSRATDCDVPLDERTTRANSIDADMFISIHANAAANEKAQGIETFCIKPNLFTRDSAGSKSLCAITDTLCAKRAQESAKLAALVQKNICTSAASKHINVKNRGVKHAAAQVLVGSQMPSILVELGFVSNPHEAKLLASSSYQTILAQGIFRAVRAYTNY